MVLFKTFGHFSFKIFFLVFLSMFFVAVESNVNQNFNLNQTLVAELSKDYKSFIKSLGFDGPSLKTRRHLDTVGHIPTARQRVYLYCRTGFFLQILPSNLQHGKVNGTHDPHAHAALLELQIFNHQVRQVKGVSSGRYLSMTDTGRLVSTANKNDLGFFRENEEENDWYTYNPVSTASHCGRTKVIRKKHKEWFIAIKENGSLRKPCRTKPGQQATQFIWIKERKLKHILKTISRS